MTLSPDDPNETIRGQLLACLALLWVLQMYLPFIIGEKKKNRLSNGIGCIAKEHGDDKEPIHQRQRSLLFVPSLYRNDEPLLFQTLTAIYMYIYICHMQ